MTTNYRVKIFNAVEGLSDLDTCSNIKRLTNHKYNYRFRVDSYRVFFDLIDGEETNYYDKVPSKFADYNEADFKQGGFRVVPPAP